VHVSLRDASLDLTQYKRTILAILERTAHALVAADSLHLAFIRDELRGLSRLPTAKVSKPEDVIQVEERL
jgi:hypothetical protein